jgi:hypothetical protein
VNARIEVILTGPKTRGILSGITKRYKENTPITIEDWRRFWSRSREIKELQAHLNHLLSICRVSRRSSLLEIITRVARVTSFLDRAMLLKEEGKGKNPPQKSLSPPSTQEIWCGNLEGPTCEPEAEQGQPHGVPGPPEFPGAEKGPEALMIELDDLSEMKIEQEEAVRKKIQLKADLDVGKNLQARLTTQEGVELLTVLDTGAGVSIAGEGLEAKFDMAGIPRIRIEPISLKISGVNSNAPVPVVGLIRVP